MPDITTEADVRVLVDTFYGKVRQDALLDPIFSDVAKVDWEHHLPKMYAFWNGMILGKAGYNGRPFRCMRCCRSVVSTSNGGWSCSKRR